jgi:hypothetical protein
MNDNYAENEVVETTEYSSYSENTFRVAGKLYYLANPIFLINNWQELVDFVDEYSYYLTSESPVIRCMREAGYRMQNETMRQFEPGAGHRAYESAISMGANMDQAYQIQSNIESGQIQFYVMGQELVWLSQVIPKAAQGNWDDFLNTGPYFRKQNIDYVILMAQIFASMGEMELLSYVMGLLPYYQPYAEYQTAIMVSWFII